MQLLDVVAATLVAGAAAAFTVGAALLARASDVEALYYFALGLVALRAGGRLT